MPIYLLTLVNSVEVPWLHSISATYQIPGICFIVCIYLQYDPHCQQSNADAGRNLGLEGLETGMLLYFSPRLKHYGSNTFHLALSKYKKVNDVLGPKISVNRKEGISYPERGMDGRGGNSESLGTDFL